MFANKGDAQRRKLILNIAAVKFIVAGHHSFTVVNQPQFRAFLAAIGGNFPPTDRRHISGLVRSLAKYVRGELRQLLRPQAHLSFSFDGLKSKNQRAFLGITVHWLRAEDWSVQSAFLACNEFTGACTGCAHRNVTTDVFRRLHTGPQTAANIKANLKKVIVEEYGVTPEQGHCISPDNTASVLKSVAAGARAV